MGDNIVDGANIFGDTGRRRRGAIGMEEAKPKQEDMEALLQQHESSQKAEEDERTAAARRAKQLQVFQAMLKKSGFTTLEMRRHMHHLKTLGNSEGVAQGRVSKHIYDTIWRERQFDRYHRPVKTKKEGQKKLVNNIKAALIAKAASNREKKEQARGAGSGGSFSLEDGEEDTGTTLKTEKWKIGYKKQTYAPPGLAAPVTRQLNSEGNEIFFSYDGTWHGGKMQGSGTFKFADGFTYYGQFKDNKPHGEGKASYPNGHTYEGYWRDGLYHGRGKLVTGVSGSVYEGEWKLGKRHGYGELTFRTGYTYKGQWLVGRQHGRGEVHCPRTKCGFRGFFQRGLASSGSGTMYFCDPPGSKKVKTVVRDYSFSRGASLRDIRNYMVSWWLEAKRDQEADKDKIFGVEVAIMVQEYTEQCREEIVREREEEKSRKFAEKRRADQMRRDKIKQKSLEAMKAMMRGSEEGDE